MNLSETLCLEETDSYTAKSNVFSSGRRSINSIYPVAPLEKAQNGITGSFKKKISPNYSQEKLQSFAKSSLISSSNKSKPIHKTAELEHHPIGESGPRVSIGNIGRHLEGKMKRGGASGAKNQVKKGNK